MEINTSYRFTRMSFWFYLFVLLGLGFMALLYFALFLVPPWQMTGEVYISIGIALVFGLLCIYQVVKAKRLVITPQALTVLSWTSRTVIPRNDVAGITFDQLQSVYGDSAATMDIVLRNGRKYRISGLAVARTSKLSSALRACNYEYGADQWDK